MTKRSNLSVTLKRAGGWCEPVCAIDEWTSELPNRTSSAVGFGDQVSSLPETKVSCFSANKGGTTGSSSFSDGEPFCILVKTVVPLIFPRMRGQLRDELIFNLRWNMFLLARIGGLVARIGVLHLRKLGAKPTSLLKTASIKSTSKRSKLL